MEISMVGLGKMVYKGIEYGLMEGESDLRFF